MRQLVLVLMAALLPAADSAAQDRYGHDSSNRSTSTQPAGIHLFLTEEVFSSLGQIADTLRRETVRCLIGGMRHDSLIVDIAWEPPTTQSTAHSVRYSDCPTATIALWHNHIPNNVVGPEYACYLSDVDIQAALHKNAPPLQVVQVTSGVLCWWRRSQIAAAEGRRILWPLASQRLGRHVTLASSCVGRARWVRPCALLSEPVRAALEEEEMEVGGGESGLVGSIRRVRKHPNVVEANKMLISRRIPQPF